MRVLILHLSDLHLSSEVDILHGRAPQIVEAVRNIDLDLDRVLVAATGDIAFSGAELEYVLASEFFDSLRTALESAFPNKPLDFICVPGNHDCDFSDSQKLRDVIMERIAEDPSTALERDFCRVCLQVQAGYSAFEENLCTLTRNEVRSNPLHTSSILGDDDEDAVQVFCLNTAWMSRINETQGTLLFPPELVPLEPEAPVVIALLHHPYVWLQADNSRRLRDRLEQIADILLTGHEHEADRRTLETAHGQRVSFFEGGCLQHSAASQESAFNAIVLDTRGRRQKYAQFVWDETRYVLGDLSIRGEDGRGLCWIPFLTHMRRNTRTPELDAAFRATLEDPGASFVQDHRNLRLQDLYVPPDLLKPPDKPTTSTQLILSQDVLRLLISSSEEGGRILISGDEQAGKTSLARMVFLTALEDRMLPLLLDGRDSYPSGDAIFGYLERKFESQYASPDLEAYRQLPKHGRLVILDDYHLLTAPPRRRLEIIESLTKFANHVILLSDEFSSAIEEILHGADSLSFQPYRIQPFGFRRRQELVEKWLFAADPRVQEPERMVRRLNEVERTVNAVVGRNFVPAYPIYLLAILQATEAAVPIDISAGTHGYYYELLIGSSFRHPSWDRRSDSLIRGFAVRCAPARVPM